MIDGKDLQETIDFLIHTRDSMESVAYELCEIYSLEEPLYVDEWTTWQDLYEQVRHQLETRGEE